MSVPNHVAIIMDGNGRWAAQRGWPRIKGHKEGARTVEDILEAAAEDQGQGRTISDIAEDLRITLPSVTVAINKLVKKGYVSKVRDENDGRRVYVFLTDKGMQMDRVHRFFHKKLVSNIASGLTESEKEALYAAMQKMNGFFEKRLTKEKP